MPSRKVLFWAGLIVASALALQLLGRAVSQFSLPHVVHPCLLMDNQRRLWIRSHLKEEPWSELFTAVKAAAQSCATPETDWLAYTTRLRAAACAYALSGETEFAQKAAQMLAAYPAPLSAGPRSCYELSIVTLGWAQAYDLTYEYISHRPNYRHAAVALARLAQRLYHISPGLAYRDSQPEVSWLARACGLCTTALALADYPLPQELGSPRTWYVEGRSELRRCLPAWLSPKLIFVREIEAVGDLLRAVVPLAVAVRRVCGDDLLDRAEWLEMARWLLTTRLPDGSRLDWSSRPAAPFPVHLLVASGTYGQAFAGEMGSITEGRSDNDVIDALCLLPAVEPQQPQEELKTARFGDGLALRSSWGDEASILALGPPVENQCDVEHGNNTLRVPLVGAWSGDRWSGEVLFSHPLVARQPGRFPWWVTPSLQYETPQILTLGWAAPDSPVCGLWQIEGRGYSIELDFVLAGSAGCIIRIRGLQVPNKTKIRIALADEAPTNVFMASTKTASKQLRLLHGEGSSCVELSTTSPNAVGLLAPVGQAWKLTLGPSSVGLQTLARREGAEWQAAISSGEQVCEMAAGAVRAGSKFSVAHLSTAGQLRGLLLMETSHVRVHGKTVWESGTAKTVCWTPRAGVCLLGEP